MLAGLGNTDVLGDIKSYLSKMVLKEAREFSNSWRKQKAKKGREHRQTILLRHLDEKEETHWKVTKEVLKRHSG